MESRKAFFVAQLKEKNVSLNSGRAFANWIAFAQALATNDSSGSPWRVMQTKKFCPCCRRSWTDCNRTQRMKMQLGLWWISDFVTFEKHCPLLRKWDLMIIAIIHNIDTFTVLKFEWVLYWNTMKSPKSPNVFHGFSRQKLVQKWSKAQVIFEEAQQIIESMKFPKALKEAMHQAMTEVGQKDGEERLTKLLPNCN